MNSLLGLVIIGPVMEAKHMAVPISGGDSPMPAGPINWQSADDKPCSRECEKKHLLRPTLAIMVWRRLEENADMFD